ncbi:MAG: pseudouridine synthase [Bacteroidetes bacterium]|nr:pseudouridine synthase [Bacteroidota bacterium]
MNKKVYYIIYKPFQVLSQFSKEENKKTLANFFDVEKDVYPVGRLDYDSEGLLILTNDKQLNHKLLNPLFKHKREYWVQVDGTLNDEALQKIQQGIIINVDGKEYKTKPCTAKLFDQEPNVYARFPPIRIRQNIPTSWISLILTEGKNRQVRKMTAAIGFPTLRLIRNSIENIDLNPMQPGSIVQLSQQKIYEKLFSTIH